MTDEQRAIVPIEKREVEFYGDMLIGAIAKVSEDAELEVYVPIAPICDYLGLDPRSQRRRISRDPVLDKGRVIMTLPSTGGLQETLCLPLHLLPGWLFGIESSRVRPELKEKIDRYRAECFRILWNTFRHDIMPPADLAPIRNNQSSAQMAYEIATAVQHLAHQQLEQEQRLSEVEDSQQRARQWARSVNSRLDSLELQLSPTAHISQEQAGELALAVKNVGNALERQSSGKGNGYQRVYGELYRRYSVSSYKSLPQGKFDEVMTWLKQWFEELSGGATT